MIKTPAQQARFDEMKKQINESLRRKATDNEERRKESEKEQALLFDSVYFDCMNQVDAAEKEECDFPEGILIMAEPESISDDAIVVFNIALQARRVAFPDTYVRVLVMDILEKFPKSAEKLRAAYKNHIDACFESAIVSDYMIEFDNIVIQSHQGKPCKV